MIQQCKSVLVGELIKELKTRTGGNRVVITTSPDIHLSKWTNTCNERLIFLIVSKQWQPLGS